MRIGTFTLHYSDPVHLSKRISFGKLYEGEPGFAPCGPGQISAEIHIDPEGHLDFYPFDKPTYASLEPVTMKAVQRCRGRRDLPRKRVLETENRLRRTNGERQKSRFTAPCL